MSDNSQNSIYDDLVHEYITLEYERAPIEARMNEIKKVLRDLDYGSHQIAGATVSVSRNARLDSKKFADMFPIEQFPNLWKTAPDTTALRQTQPPAVVEALQSVGEPRITIK